MTDETETITLSTDDPGELRGLSSEMASAALLALARAAEELAKRLAARDEQVACLTEIINEMTISDGNEGGPLQ